MSSYHGGTHAPKAQGGTDPIPIAGASPVRFRARRKTTFQTLTDASEIDLQWNFWENEDDGVFGAYDSGGVLETTTTDPIRSVRLLVPAYVINYVTLSVQALSAGSLACVLNDGYDSPECIVHPAYTFGAGADYTFGFAGKTYPMFDPSDDPAGEAVFSIDAAQNSGVSRNTQFGTYWEIAAWVL
jgi:hypothetical protein